MKHQVIYGVRLTMHPTAWIGTTEDFHDKIIHDDYFSTYDINKAHQFMEWMNSGNEVYDKRALECIVAERATDYYF